LQLSGSTCWCLLFKMARCVINLVNLVLLFECVMEFAIDLRCVVVLVT
jgi:hypothetical protein